MIMKKFLSAVFALVAVAVAAAAVYLGFTYRNAQPVLLTPPLTAKSQAVAMMNSLCRGDFDGVSQRILGNPGLGLDRDAAEDVSVLIWDSYVESLSYDLVGTCYATDNGLAQDVTITCLDMTSVTANLQERTQTLLEERVENTKNLTEIYDENNEYREEFVMNALYDAALDALEEDAVETTVELTLNLSYQDGQWWVVADSQLLDAISGGILY